MCWALLAFMISFNIILPELNGVIAKMGGHNLKGLIIALFSFSAGLSRPFSGKLSDTIGRKKVMIFGHNFAFTNIANALGDNYIDNLPTAGLVVLEFETDSWSNLGEGRTLKIIIPKHLR